MLNLNHSIVSDYPLSEGEHLRIDVRLKEESGFVPLIVFSHGFKSYRNWGFIPYMCRQLTNAGAIVVNFDFGLNGIENDDDPLQYNTENLYYNTVSHETYDLQQVVNYVKTLPEVIERHNGLIHLIGHSRGGAVSVLAANKLNTNKELINSITMLNALATFDRFTVRQKAIWNKTGEISFKNKDTCQKLAISIKYLEDITRAHTDSRYHIALRALEIPVIIIQATEDLVVKPYESEFMAQIISGSKLYKIPKVGHDFGIGKNENKPTKEINAVIEIIKFHLFGLAEQKTAEADALDEQMNIEQGHQAENEIEKPTSTSECRTN